MIPINKEILATILIIIATFVTGIYVGAVYFPQHYYTEKTIETPAEIKETVRHEVETVVQYLPKEIIIYKDPVSGEEISRKENTDVEANIGQPAVNVKVNGQDYSFSLLQDEKQKFEDGKLVLNQSSNIGIELVVKPQVIDRTKHGGVDLIAGKYSGIGVKHKRFGIDATVNVRDRNDVMLQGRWTVGQW